MQTSNMKRELLAREVQGALQTTQAIAISSGYSPELVERQFLNTLHTLVEDIETPSWDWAGSVLSAGELHSAGNGYTGSWVEMLSTIWLSCVLYY